ncbi:13349_t:CDS:1, partial [Entrophospora sp. SA101]
TIKYGLEMKEKNNLKRMLRYKHDDEQNKWNNCICVLSGLFTALLIKLHVLLYLEIAFWFDLNDYLSKLLWNAIALEITIAILDLLREDDTQVLSPE